MPKFVNINPHEVYVDDPDDDERDLTRIYPNEEVSASGAFADRLAATSGMLDTSSDEFKERKQGLEGKAKTEDSDDDEGKFSVDSPEVLAVGPDLEAPEPSKEDDEATEAGIREAEKERAADEEAAAKQESKSSGKKGGTTTTAKVPTK